MTKVLLLGLLLSVIPTIAEPAKERAIMQPRTVVEVYTFYRLQTARTRDLSFEDKRTGFTIKRNQDGSAVCEDILYVKTFGGRPPSPTIHLINSRYVIYPATVPDSDIADTLFHDMMAITHVFDMKRGKLIHSSKPYQYDHDVPLKYDLEEVLLLGLMEEAHDN